LQQRNININRFNFIYLFNYLIMEGLSTALGASIIVIAASLGIGWIGSKAMDAIARQPEAASMIQTSMIIAAALIEGATLFAIVVLLITA
jgi:F-type H+-transporting ATPase subunit c